MEIIDYPLKEFLQQPQELIDDYMSYLKFLQPIPTVKKVYHMKLKDVEFIKNNLYGEIVDVICMVEKRSVDMVLAMPITRLFGLYNSVKQQIENISKAEKNGLGGDGGDPRFEAVGGGAIMARYGIYNTILPLSEQFGWTVSQIENMPYSEIFTILLYNKDRENIQTKMSLIKI